MMDALVCLTDNSWHPSLDGPSCNDAREYARLRHHFPQAFSGVDEAPATTKLILTQELQKRVDDLMRRELETHVVTVPILGISVDGNDLWLLSSLLMIFMLRILWACLEREFDNLRRASIRATDDVKRELIIMSQLFATRLDHFHPIPVLLFMPVGINLYILYDDYVTFPVGRILRGLWPWVEALAFHIALTLLVGVLCLLCFLAARKIEKLPIGLEAPLLVDIGGSNGTQDSG
jgi:hypothetical protein